MRASSPILFPFWLNYWIEHGLDDELSLQRSPSWAMQTRAKPLAIPAPNRFRFTDVVPVAALAPCASKLTSIGEQVELCSHVRLKLVSRRNESAVVGIGPVEQPLLSQNSPLKRYPSTRVGLTCTSVDEPN